MAKIVDRRIVPTIGACTTRSDMAAKRKGREFILHERYDRSHPLLAELVLVQVTSDDGASFDTLLTRVPGLGEEICRENKSYKVIRVRHELVDDDGRARFGWHAFVDAELQPDESTERAGTATAEQLVG